MSYRSKYELLQLMAPRYREASEVLKYVILDEFVAATGYMVPRLLILSFIMGVVLWLIIV